MKTTTLPLLLFLTASIFASSLPVIPTPDLSKLPLYRVARVVDGDTLSATDGKEEIKIRLSASAY